MYSTLDGAKKCAKNLKRLFDDSGFIHPLKKCQTAVAAAGGYRDWHELERSLGSASRPLDPAQFRKRLLAALPTPCVATVQAWLDQEPREEQIDPRVPRRWYRDVFPYLMVSARLHRGAALLRPGSGTGQRLRENLVVGLLLNIHGGHRPYPRLEPDTLALVFEGDLAALFRKDAEHRRFQEELKTLIDAGILDWRDRVMRVLPQAGYDLVAEVVEDRADMAQHWAEDGDHVAEEANAIRDALAAIGVADALRVADAIAQQGSAAYVTPSGAVLTLLSDLAAQGEMATFARTVGLFATIRPANSNFVLESVPAKISAQYLGGALRLSGSKILAWASTRPDWASDLKAAVVEPGRFTQTVDAMAQEIADHAA